MMVLALIYLPPSEKNMDRSVDQYVDRPVDWNENKGRAIHGSIRGLGGPPRPLTKKSQEKTKTKYRRPLHKGRVHKGRARHKLRTEPRIFLNEFALVCLIVLALTTLLKTPIS